MTVWTRWRKPVFLERSVRVNDGGEKQTLVIFSTWIYMLLQSVTTVARKLLVDEKITVCVKQICLQRVVCKGKRQLSGETFCLLEKRLLSTSKHCASSNLLFFYKLLICPQPTFSECIVITCISCNPIGQLCLSGPSYICRTVMWLQVTTKTWQTYLQWMKKSPKLKRVFFLLR